MRLFGKVAVVTGAASGIGKAIACAMAGEGADVALLDVNRQGAEAAAREAARAERRAIGLACDVSLAHDVERAVQAAQQALGPIEILVNCAGIASPPGLPFTRNTEDDWQNAFDVNVKSVFLMCSAVAPGLIARGHGRIVNIASTAAMIAAPLMPPYTVSKGAVITFTRVLARELARHDITVNAVCPGFVWSELWEKLGPELARADSRFAGLAARQIFDQRVRELVPLGRPQTAEDVAEAVVFLASDAARSITGQALAVDGGVTI